MPGLVECMAVSQHPKTGVVDVAAATYKDATDRDNATDMRLYYFVVPNEIIYSK